MNGMTYMSMGSRVIHSRFVCHRHLLDESVDLSIFAFSLVDLLLGLQALNLDQILLTLDLGVTSDSDS